MVLRPRNLAWCLLAVLLAVGFIPHLPAESDKANSRLSTADDKVQKQASDWPLFRGNALQTGVADLKPSDDLKLRWKFETKDTIEAAAAIVGDTVYIGSMDKHLYAIDLATGKEKWKYKAGPFKAPPSVRDGVVYVGDANGLFHTIDAANGTKKWTFKTEGEITSGANFAGDNVLFGSGDENLYCLSKDGKKVWEFKVEGGPVNGSPVVIGERTFVAGCDSVLHVLDTTKGKELGAVELEGQVAATAAVVGEQLYVGTMTGQFQAVDWKNAKVLWTFEAERRPQAYYASAAVTDKLVIAGSRDKRVYALERGTGKEKWSFLTEGRVDSSPVVAGSQVYAASLDGHLYVLDLTNGKELKKIKLGEEVLASPAVGKGCLIVGNDKGEVFCYE